MYFGPEAVPIVFLIASIPLEVVKLFQEAFQVPHKTVVEVILHKAIIPLQTLNNQFILYFFRVLYQFAYQYYSKTLWIVKILSEEHSDSPGPARDLQAGVEQSVLVSLSYIQYVMQSKKFEAADSPFQTLTDFYWITSSTDFWNILLMHTFFSFFSLFFFLFL